MSGTSTLELCEACHLRPKFVGRDGVTYPYCGRTCSKQDRKACPFTECANDRAESSGFCERHKRKSPESQMICKHPNCPHWALLWDGYCTLAHLREATRGSSPKTRPDHHANARLLEYAGPSALGRNVHVIASGGRDLSNIYRWPGSLAGSPATRVRPTRNRHFEFHERLKQPGTPSSADVYALDMLMSLSNIDTEALALQTSMMQIAESHPRSPLESVPSSPSPSGQSASPPPRRIYFYHRHQSHYGFTNFSPHPVTFQNKVYPTGEHLFQALKRPGLAEHIRLCWDEPGKALTEGSRFQPEVRPDWLEVQIDMMETVLQLKFNQNESLEQELIETLDAELIMDADEDSFWGIGRDRKGQNEFGKALMRLRTAFLEEREESS